MQDVKYTVVNVATKEVKRSFSNLVPCYNAADKLNDKAGYEMYKVAFYVNGEFSHWA